MELCAHGTLRQHLGEGPLPVHRAVAHHAEVLSALVSAHRRGVVHRDLKPANLLYRRPPSAIASEIVLCDFGIAHLADAADAAERRSRPRSRSRRPSAAHAPGTLAYMAPEQRAGKAVAASDVYAAAVILFETLTGRLPWSRDVALRGTRTRSDLALPAELAAGDGHPSRGAERSSDPPGPPRRRRATRRRRRARVRASTRAPGSGINRLMRTASVLLVVLAAACKTPDPPPITDRWSDDFERDDIGGDYLRTADVYDIEDGWLHVENAYNRPMWLRKKLPQNATIEFTVRSESPAGDIKVEAWGDGKSYDPDKGSYAATGYVFVFGGWNNSKSIIARMDEHGDDVASRTRPQVEKGKQYRFRIVRQGQRIDWFIDDMTTPFLSLEDPKPLTGPDHSYFGFNDWEASLWFDDLVVAPGTP